MTSPSLPTQLSGKKCKVFANSRGADHPLRVEFEMHETATGTALERAATLPPLVRGAGAQKSASLVVRADAPRCGLSPNVQFLPGGIRVSNGAPARSRQNGCTTNNRL